MSAIPGRHVLIVEARFYQALADELAAGAIAVLERQGVAHSRWAVPGSFELPGAIRCALAAMQAGTGPQFDGFIALGCVIKGETDHYEHICREASRGLMDLTVQHAIALGFGLLSCQTYALAEARVSVTGKNKGADAAHACLAMMDLRRSLSLTPR